MIMRKEGWRMSKRAYLKEAAETLGISQWALRSMAKSGEIPCWKTGNRYIFDIQQCEDFLNEKAMGNLNTKSGNTDGYGLLRKCGGN